MPSGRVPWPSAGAQEAVAEGRKYCSMGRDPPPSHIALWIQFGAMLLHFWFDIIAKFTSSIFIINWWETTSFKIAGSSWRTVSLPMVHVSLTHGHLLLKRRKSAKPVNTLDIPSSNKRQSITRVPVSKQGLAPIQHSSSSCAARVQHLFAIYLEIQILQRGTKLWQRERGKSTGWEWAMARRAPAFTATLDHPLGRANSRLRVNKKRIRDVFKSDNVEKKLGKFSN